MKTMLIIIFISFLFFIGCCGVYMIVDGFQNMEMFLIGMGIIIVLTGFGLPLSIFYDYNQNKHAIKESIPVILEIENKEHINAHTQVIYNGKITSCIHHSEQNNIIVTDGENKEAINNKNLYNSLNKGDKIEGYKILYKKKNGKIYKTQLKIKEDN